jgi:glycosyltransferase involved in cell wall biosynthesis/thioredoxin-like negative regulator of GroEL
MSPWQESNDMRITWLLEVADQLWGGVKVALEDANWLQQHGHQVTVLSRSGPPSWMKLECAFRTVQDFRPENLPDGDIVIGTFWTTVPWAASAGARKGVPVHYCQGYEGDNPENVKLRDRIEAAYRLKGVEHVTISKNLTNLLREHFGIEAKQVTYTIDHEVHRPGPERRPDAPLRVGLVGPYQVDWKDLATGYEACRLAHLAGQPIVLVRATNTTPAEAERNTPFPVEWHHQLPPAQMGDYYRSLDVFLGTSRGAEEGFFLPAVEAMACGIPSVLTDIPCFRSHGDGRSEDLYAMFVPPRDPAAMAEALIVTGRVPEVRTALRREGLRTASRYTRDRHGADLEAVLQGFVDARQVRTAEPPAQTVARTPLPVPAERSALRLVEPTCADAASVVFDVLQRLRREATQFLHHQQPETAARLLAAAACLDPDDTDLQRQVAEARHLAGDHAGALSIYDALSQRGIDDEALHAARGHALHALGAMAEAAQAFRAALAVGLRTADAYNRLGVVLYQAGEVAAARQSFERALVLQPNHTDASANLAALLAA